MTSQHRIQGNELQRLQKVPQLLLNLCFVHRANLQLYVVIFNSCKVCAPFSRISTPCNEKILHKSPPSRANSESCCNTTRFVILELKALFAINLAHFHSHGDCRLQSPEHQQRIWIRWGVVKFRSSFGLGPCSSA